jgi:uncharacterized membrane protein YoaK (UPF0700 family)
VLLTLTAVSGLIDAVTYLGIGRIFTANMTGNVVVLGFAAAGAPGFSVPRAATSLGTYLAGAVTGGRIADITVDYCVEFAAAMRVSHRTARHVTLFYTMLFEMGILATTRRPPSPPREPPASAPSSRWWTPTGSPPHASGRC